jgi:hypothetical protein
MVAIIQPGDSFIKWLERIIVQGLVNLLGKLALVYVENTYM